MGGSWYGRLERKSARKALEGESAEELERRQKVKVEGLRSGHQALGGGGKGAVCESLLTDWGVLRVT